MGFFNSPVQDSIEEATDEKLNDVNWALNMQICDTINREEDGPSDAIKTIGKRLQNSNWKVSQFALTLLDTCLKNCDIRFHKKFAKKEFQKVLKEIVTNKKTLPIVRDRVLESIQNWSEEFRQHPESQIAVQTYEDLKREGIEFPQREHTGPRAPIFTPPARASATYPTVAPTGYPTTTYPTSAPAPGAAPYSYPTGYSQQPLAATVVPAGYAPSQYPAATQYPPPGAYPAPAAAYPPQQRQQAPRQTSMEQQRRKLIDDINVVRESINILCEALNATNPMAEDVSRNEVITEFATSCRQMRPRVTQLIETLNDEMILADLLVIIDDLNRVLEAYEMACRRQPIPMQVPVPPMSSNVPQPAPTPQPQPQMRMQTPVEQPSQQPAIPVTGMYAQVIEPQAGAYYTVAAPAPYSGTPVYATGYPVPTATGYPSEPYTAQVAQSAAPSLYPPPPAYSGSDVLSATSVMVDLNDARASVAASQPPVDQLAALGLTATAATAAATQPRSTAVPPKLEPPPAKLPPRRVLGAGGSVAAVLPPSQRRLPPMGETQPQSVAPLLPEFASDAPVMSPTSAAEYSGVAATQPLAASPAAPKVGEYGVPVSPQAAAEDDGFAAIARRHEAPVDDGFAAIAARHSAKPSAAAMSALGLGAPTPLVTEAEAHSTERVDLLSGIGQHRSTDSPAAVPRGNRQEYMQMRSDDMYNL